MQSEEAEHRWDRERDRAEDEHGGECRAIDAGGKRVWVKWHLKTQQGIRNLSAADAVRGAFLHLALHLALREQLATDRPPGIARIDH